MSKESGSIYEHCVRAIALSLSVGAHGLPLMGIGDWNDGMSLVGAGGRGESVWLGWFLVSLLRPFADVAEARGEADRAAVYRTHAGKLTGALDDAWDGEWYRRAYFDDGTPLGSKENTECRIDAIAQSWAVISGAGRPERARQAMASTDRHLVREKDGIILLLTPPFDKMTPSPGYIQGYVPGVRENGGQYTHAALWTILAHAQFGNGDRAEALFRTVESDQPRHRCGERRALPRRALRRRGRRLLTGPSRRTRRMDVVHGVGRLDVPGRDRDDARCDAAARRAAHRPVHPERRGRATR